jgi:hypothetical protein
VDDPVKNFWREFLKFLKFCFYVVQIWLCTAIIVVVKVWHHPLWHANLLRFIGRVWVKFVAEQVGSTSPGFVNSIIAVLVSLFLGGIGIWYFQGWRAMRTHLIETIAMGIVVFFTVTFLVYGTQFAWEVAKEAYGDHQTLAAIANTPKPVCPMCPTCPSCPTKEGHTKPPPVAPERIHDASADIRLVCTLRNLSRMPQDVLFGGGLGTKNNSYLQGNIGKAYLEQIPKTHYQRVEEEGKVSVSESYSLPSNSDLLNQRITELANYDKIVLNVAGADGDDFSACVFYEVEFRVNGRDIYRVNGAIPDGSMSSGHSFTIILKFTKLDLPK